MAEIDFNKLTSWQKIICIVLFILLGWGIFCLFELYCSNWPFKIKWVCIAISWVSCSNGVSKLLNPLFNKYRKDK
jgi:hypothetical protein